VRPPELERRVVEAIAACRSRGVPAEDDYVECKRQRPEPKGARQLGGLCNRAAGADVVLIVGFDDTAGTFHDVVDTDPADWWAQMASQFDDETPPDMTRMLRVTVGDVEHVVAFAFDTTRVPFVVKNSSGVNAIEREVPYRDGTRTRSAYRRDMMRQSWPRPEPVPPRFVAVLAAAVVLALAPYVIGVLLLYFVNGLHHLPVQDITSGHDPKDMWPQGLAGGVVQLAGLASLMLTPLALGVVAAVAMCAPFLGPVSTTSGGTTLHGLAARPARVTPGVGLGLVVVIVVCLVGVGFALSPTGQALATWRLD
jgi:hypothetical protein